MDRFGKTDLGKKRFWTNHFWKIDFWMMSSPRSCFRKNAFWEIISLKCLENAWKNLRTVDPRIEAKNQGAKFQLKKAWPKSQARSYKKSIQISKQQRGAASGAAQKRGGALKRAAPFLGCCFEIWIDFLKDLAWLFGQAFFSWILAPWFLASILGWTVRRFFQAFSKHFKEMIFQKAFFKNSFLEKTPSKKRLPGEDIIQKRLLGEDIIKKWLPGKDIIQKRFLGEDTLQKTTSWRRHHPKTASWRRHYRKTVFLEKTSSKKRLFGEDFIPKTTCWRRLHPKNDFLEKTSSKNDHLEKTSAKNIDFP